MKRITKILELADNYDVFLFDIWGVIVADDQNFYPGVIEAINELSKIKPVYLLSNSPRPRLVSATRLQALGLGIEEERIFTSGDLTRELLLEPKKAFDFDFDQLKLYHMEARRNKDILHNLDIDIVSHPSDANAMLLTLFTDVHEDVNPFYHQLDEALQYNLPIICPNPDLKLSDFRYCAGYFAEYYKSKSGIVHYIGKPYKNIFDYMYKNIQEKVDLSKIILIGDTFYTDILGANNYGIKSGLVLTGNSKVLTDAAFANSDEEKIKALMAQVNHYKATPDYYIHLGL